jgi:hypothetical protein
MRKSSRLIGALVAAGVVVSGGAAFTASNTFASGATQPLTGYATTTVTGGTVNSLKYNLDAAGANVVSVALVLANNTTTSNVSMNFNGGTAFSCGTGTATSTSPITTSYTCTPSAPEAVSSLTSTGVSIN